MIVYGRVSAREEEEPKLVVEEAYPLDEASAAQYKLSYGDRMKTAARRSQQKPLAKAKTLYLRLDSLEDPRFESVKETLRINRGNCRVVFYFAEEKKRMEATSLRAADDQSFLDVLSRMLGRDNVVLK